MKKVLYVITSLSHKRVFESFMVRDDLKQMIVGPKPVKNEGIVPEDYSDFGIKNIKYFNNNKDLQNIVNRYGPDIYVQASLPCAKGIKLPPKCKKVYVSHGMVGNHVKAMIKPCAFDTSVWKGCDLYCGATPVFADWVKHVAKVGDNKILLNALPQLDILHTDAYYNSYSTRVLNKIGYTNPNKVILFVGFCCKNRHDFTNHNEDYFRTVLGLERLARKHNWLVMVKPRQTFGAMKGFLKTHGWGKKYIKPYSDIQSSKHLHFITTSGHIYRYMFADCIVVNGTSTVEVEACAINKPLVIVRTNCKNNSDPYDTITKQAAYHVNDIKYLGDGIDKAINQSSEYQQTRLIEQMGISFDGKMHKRIQDRLVAM